MCVQVADSSSSRGVGAWALVSSPLQALAVSEACSRFGINPALSRVLLLSESQRGMDQTRECLSKLQWGKVEELPGVSTPRELRRSRERVDDLAIRKAPEIFLLGDFRRLLGQHIARKWAKHTILVDDGSALHRFARDRRRMHPPSGEARWRAPQWLRRMSHRIRYGLQTGELPPMTIFTIYPDLVFDPRDKVVLNDFRELRRGTRLERCADEVWIVGGCLVELGLVTAEYYEQNIAAIARKCESSTLHYFPHRREDEAKLHRYAKQFRLRVHHDNLPLELYLMSSGRAPGKIYGFYSTALDTLYRLTESVGTLFYAIHIPSEEIVASEEDRVFIETVYDYFSRYSSRFSIVDSHA